VDNIADTAMTVVTLAAKYSDRITFNVPEAFEILYDTIALFDGAHFQSARTRRHLVEALNIALSCIPGNQVSIRCVELTGEAFALEWLPYINWHLANASRPRL